MVRVEGHTGALCVGYQVAATLGVWALELLPELPRRYRFEAKVTAVSEHWLAQRPIDVVVDVGPKRWLWRGVEPSLAGATLTLTLQGMPQVTETALMEMTHSA